MSEKPVEPSSKWSKNRKILIVLGVLIVLLIIPIVPQNYKVIENQSKTETYTEKEPYDVTQTVTVSEPYQVTEWVTVQQPVQVDKPFLTQLIDDTISVPAGNYFYYSITVDLSDTKNNIISGSVSDTAGYGITFIVLDRQGFTAWESDHSKGSPYVKFTNVISITFPFVPTHTDTYYFVLDNTYSWFSNKLPHISVNWSGSRTVTEMQSVQQPQIVTKYHDVQKTQTVTLYRDVQKTRTIIVPVEVTKTRYMSFIQLITGS